jgi:hypothetical protein
VAQHFVIPGIQGGANSTSILLIIGMVGTTVAPWQLFFQQSNIIDMRSTPRWFNYERLDTWIVAIVVVVGAAALIGVSAFAFRHTHYFGQFSNAGATATGLDHVLRRRLAQRLADRRRRADALDQLRVRGRLPWLNVLAIVIVAVLVLLSLILMATTAFPNIDVTAVALGGGAVLAVGLSVAALLSLRSRRRGGASPRPSQVRPFPRSSGRCHPSPSSRVRSGPPVAKSRCSRSPDTWSYPSLCSSSRRSSSAADNPVRSLSRPGDGLRSDAVALGERGE